MFCRNLDRTDRIVGKEQKSRHKIQKSKFSSFKTKRTFRETVIFSFQLQKSNFTRESYWILIVRR